MVRRPSTKTLDTPSSAPQLEAFRKQRATAKSGTKGAAAEAAQSSTAGPPDYPRDAESSAAEATSEAPAPRESPGSEGTPSSDQTPAAGTSTPAYELPPGRPPDGPPPLSVQPSGLQSQKVPVSEERAAQSAAHSSSAAGAAAPAPPPPAPQVGGGTSSPPASSSRPSLPPWLVPVAGSVPQPAGYPVSLAPNPSSGAPKEGGAGGTLHRPFVTPTAAGLAAPSIPFLLASPVPSGTQSLPPPVPPPLHLAEHLPLPSLGDNPAPADSSGPLGRDLVMQPVAAASPAAASAMASAAALRASLAALKAPPAALQPTPSTVPPTPAVERAAVRAAEPDGEPGPNSVSSALNSAFAGSAPSAAQGIGSVTALHPSGPHSPTSTARVPASPPLSAESRPQSLVAPMAQGSAAGGPPEPPAAFPPSASPTAAAPPQASGPAPATSEGSAEQLGRPEGGKPPQRSLFGRFLGSAARAIVPPPPVTSSGGAASGSGAGGDGSVGRSLASGFDGEGRPLHTHAAL